MVPLRGVSVQSYCYTVPKKKAKLPLSKTHPRLAKEADGWDPSVVTFGARGKFKWVCQNNHKFESLLSLRVQKETNCPYCANKKVFKSFNDLATTHPEIAREANGWDSSEVIAGSHKKMNWTCKNKHTYEAAIGSRTGKRATGCPICANQKLLKGFNDLATVHPDLAKEADGWDPTIVITGSNKKFMWKCSRNHSYTSPISQRIRNRKIYSKFSGCPICANQKVLIGFNDLATTHPELALEADGWDPKSVVAGTTQKKKWKCQQNHQYESNLSLRALRGTGCPYCSNKFALAGFNDLATTDPDIAITAFNWDPKTVTRGSSKKQEWKCTIGHIYKSAPMDRTGTQRRGCPYCAHQKLLVGFNDFKTTNPKAASEADGWDPSMFIGGSRIVKAWKCKKNHNYELSIQNRNRADDGCPICGNRTVLAGFNDLATLNPELAKQADGWDPSLITAGSELKVKWKCNEGHRFESVLSSRSIAGNGCPVCSNRIVLIGFNDLATTHPDLAKEADNWDPTTVTYGNETKKWWRCSDGHKFQQPPNARTQGRGCPTCAKSGFDPNKKAYLYFLSHSIWEMYQIGITNSLDERIDKHRRKGWEVIEIRGSMEGYLTQQWETAILRMLKAKGADLSNSKIAGKFDGYSEAWSKSTFPVKSIKELMRLTEEFEED